MRKKLAALGLTAGLLGGGAAGFMLSTPVVSGAETTSSTSSTSSTSATATAPDGGTLVALDDWMASALAPLVTDGTITQAQADAVAAALQAARPGPGMRAGHLIADLDTAAQAIGIDAQTLRDALQDGQTLAQVAEANGVDPQTVIDAMVGAAQSRIAEDVSSGPLTQDEADQILADVESHITDLVNGVAPQGPPDGAPGFPGPMGGPGVGRGVFPAPSTSSSSSGAASTSA
jgi:hypothetical protein